MATILSIIDTVKATQGFVRPMREGEQVMNSGMVISVGLKEKKNDVLHIQALVLRTSGITTQNPYLVEVWVDISKEYGSRLVMDQSVECGCPAGQSEKCKHVVGVLLYLSRVEESTLEDLSCTDIEQQWGALKASTLKDYEAKCLSDLCHVKLQKDVYVSTIPMVTKEMEDKWRDHLCRGAPLSEYSIFFSGVRNGYSSPCNTDDAGSREAEYQLTIHKLLTFKSWVLLSKLVLMTEQFVHKLERAEQDFYEHFVQIDMKSSVKIGATLNQEDKNWIKERSKRITGSICYSLFTYLSNSNPDWDRKFKTIYQSSFSGNSDTIHGLRCEPLARDKYKEWAKVSVIETGLLIRPELPWLGFSPDGVITNDFGEPTKIIEIKSSKEGKRLTCCELLQMKAVKSLDADGNLKKKHPHYGQVQLGMLLLGIQTTDYLVYSEIENNFIVIHVQFDMKFVEELVTSLCTIYFKKILPRLVRANLQNKT